MKVKSISIAKYNRGTEVIYYVKFTDEKHMQINSDFKYAFDEQRGDPFLSEHGKRFALAIAAIMEIQDAAWDATNDGTRSLPMWETL